MTGRRDPDGDRIFVHRVLIVIALAAVAFLLWQLRSLVLMLFGAVVVASIFRALADVIRDRARLPDGIAVALSIGLILGSIAALVTVFGGQIAAQVHVLTEALPAAWRLLEERIAAMGFGEQLAALSESARSGGGGAASGLGKVVMSVGNGIADTLVVIFGGIFLAAQPNFYRIGAIKLVPQSKRALVAEAMDDSERALRLWLRGQLFAMVVVGTLTGLGLWLIGVPSALALGLLAGMLEFIPYAGPIAAAIPGVLLALVAGPETALWTVALYVGVQQFEGYVLQPLVQQYAVDLPPVVLLFSLLGFGMLFGIIGIILAAPLTVVSYVLVKRLYVQEALGTKTPIPGEDKK
ncbi:MAG TPA: AI-2E family transporter [Sphingomicrobium sp.]|nr:AI-2E family transporter [Sphingomicrobium sp.]